MDFLRCQLPVPRKHLEKKCWEGIGKVTETEPTGERGGPRGPLLKPVFIRGLPVLTHPEHINAVAFPLSMVWSFVFPDRQFFTVQETLDNQQTIP